MFARCKHKMLHIRLRYLPATQTFSSFLKTSKNHIFIQFFVRSYSLYLISLLPYSESKPCSPRYPSSLGGGKEVRTPDLRLAKPSLSQLSYTPDKSWAVKSKPIPTHLQSRWWAWEDSNFRPHAYQACALTTWATSPSALTKKRYTDSNRSS